MRNYLTDIEIVGAVLIYQEGDICRWSLDWLYANCDRVCIVLDNYDEYTRNIVFEYRDKYPDKTHIGYTKDPIDKEKNSIPGYIKIRFKRRQQYIREYVCIELKKMHEEKPIDLLIWPDSDETFINEFSKHLEEFWNSPFLFLKLGFVEVYDSFRILVSQKMAPHGRVFKYTPKLTIHPWHSRTSYNPYHGNKVPKLRHIVVHVCHLTKEYRTRREFITGNDMKRELERWVWILPRDVREMKLEEINEYQHPVRGTGKSKYPPIPLQDYIDNKDNYLKEVPLWIKD